MGRRIKAPAAWAFKMRRTKKDFKIQHVRGTGPGGQNKNKVSTGVRLTDLITGLSVCATDSRSQDDNLIAAQERLFDKMADFYRKEYAESLELRSERSGETSIRTYKENSDRVIDHRLGEQFSYKEVLDGKHLDKIIEKLIVKRVEE